jgi:hypothetical protein
LEPHRNQTAERIAAAGRALILHDTTAFSFGGERAGLGPVHGAAGQGFLMHASLAVSADGSRRPLGLVASRTWVRKDEPRNKKPDGSKLSGSDYAKLNDKESTRWIEQVREVHVRVDGRADVIHVMDREADAYALLSDLTEERHRFVVRVSKDRVARDEDADEWSDLRTVAEQARYVVEREVALSRRVTSSIPAVKKTFPPRERRVAKLAVSVASVELRKPRYEKDKPATLTLNLVRVHEVKTPDGMAPVEWLLLTTEPVATAEDVLAVVDSYRARWVIEEYFKALKTGCQIEKLQLEDYDALCNALALHLPIAWSILLLRDVAEHEPKAPAERVLSSTQIQVLRALGPMKLSPSPTAAEAMLAVAMLGGYMKHKVRPGWLVLARGMQDLVHYERGWLARERAGTP